LFFLSTDKEHGSLLHLPYDGPLMEQPAKTRAVIELMQNIFVAHHNKRAKVN